MKEKKFLLPKISFYLSLISPVFLLLVAFGVKLISIFFLIFVVGSSLASIVTGIVSLIKISSKKLKKGMGFSITAIILGSFFFIIWIFGFIYAIALMPTF
ncbi:hypothetical protein GW932_02100 [archaeon]|nr:hypothetical protein [archaeon]